MQNRYVGDIGDFCKYGLLRYMFGESDLRLGVNWYLMPDETHTNDGKYIEYLGSPEFRNCDPLLFEKLRQLVSADKRRISFIEQDDLLPVNTLFYSVPVPIGLGLNHLRQEWFVKSLQVLRSCNVLFLDPDNGLEVASFYSGSGKAGKYVLYQEIVKYYQAGFSLIIYNHRDRSKEADYFKRFAKISEMIDKRTIMPILRFSRYSVRDYAFVIQDDKMDDITASLLNFIRSPWGVHWQYFEV
jgi:hypothetical protein